MRKKKIKKYIAIIVGICFVLVISVFLNEIFGNPVSKFLSRKSVQEYIEETYPDSDFIIEKLGYDFKNMEYYAKIVSSKDANKHFYIHTNGLGQNLDDDYDLYFDENGFYIYYYEMFDFHCKYGSLRDDNRTAEIIIEFSLFSETENSTVSLKIGETTINTTRTHNEDERAVYTAVYETDIFANYYDISDLKVEMTVTNAEESATKVLEKEDIKEFYTLLTDAYSEYLPEVKNRCAENEISYEYADDILTVSGTLRIKPDITKISEMYIVTEINNEPAKKEKIDLSQEEYSFCDEYHWDSVDFAATYAVFEDKEHGYICKYELAHWTNGDMGWLCSCYIYDSEGNLLNEPHQASADIRDIYEF